MFHPEEALESVKKSMLEGQESYFSFLDEKNGNPMSGAAKIQMKDMSRFDETLEQVKKIRRYKRYSVAERP